MNSKISEAVQREMQQRSPHEVIALTLGICRSLESDEFALLADWGGRLLFDSGLMAVVHLPVLRIPDVAGWECVTEIFRLATINPTPNTIHPTSKTIDIASCSFEEANRLADGAEQYDFGNGELCDKSSTNYGGHQHWNAEEIFDRVWRFDFTAPGFAVIDVGPVDSRTLRMQMVRLKRELSEIATRRGQKPFVYRSLSRFDQQETTKLHLDGAPPESLLMLGYEPSMIVSRLLVADYTRAAFDLKLSVDDFLQQFNPMFALGEQLLQNYRVELPQPVAGHSRIVLINNSSLSHSESQPHPLGVMHQAIIPKPDVTQSRLINSTLISTEGEEVDPLQVEQFIATDFVHPKAAL